MTFIQIFFLFLFNLVCNLFFLRIMILEHLHFCLANHASVSHLLRGQLHLLECYCRNCLIGTHMCAHPVSEWLVFFTLQGELFTSCNVFQPYVRKDRGNRGVNQMGTDLDRGRGGPENSQICADILYGWHQRLHFNGLFLIKIYNLWAKKVQSSYAW